MSPPPPPSTPQIPTAQEDLADAELPLSLTSSTLLTALPADATRALSAIVAAPRGPSKVTIKFRPLASAPALSKDTFKIKSTNRFENVVKFLREVLDVKEGGQLYTYVGWSFVPALDEEVGGLWRCFKDGEVLVVCYSIQSAFG